MKNLLLIIAISGFFACKSQKPVTPVATNTPPTPAQVTKNEPVKIQHDTVTKEPDTFRVVVAFISIGAGTDAEAGPLLDKYLIKYKTSTGIKPDFQRIVWGREGEVDNCFLLKELNPTQQKEFIEGLKTAVYGHNLIQIEENMRNRFHK